MPPRNSHPLIPFRKRRPQPGRLSQNQNAASTRHYTEEIDSILHSEPGQSSAPSLPNRRRKGHLLLSLSLHLPLVFTVPATHPNPPLKATHRYRREPLPEAAATNSLPEHEHAHKKFKCVHWYLIRTEDSSPQSQLQCLRTEKTKLSSNCGQKLKLP